jgi:hypothetical protein
MSLPLDRYCGIVSGAVTGFLSDSSKPFISSEGLEENFISLMNKFFKR